MSTPRRSILAALLLVTACNTDDADPSTRWRLTQDTLPSGTPFEIHIAVPADGSLHPLGTAIAVQGHAAIGETQFEPTTAFAYIVDLSGSVVANANCGGDANNDGLSNTFLDCEIDALEALNTLLIDAGTVDEVGVSVFGNNGFAADMNPAPGIQVLTHVDTDVGDVLGNFDVIDVLQSTAPNGVIDLYTASNVGGFTSYGNGIIAAGTILSDASRTNKVAVLVSDGLNNTGPDVATAVDSLPAGTRVHSFAIGSAQCDEPSTFGNLRTVATETGGTCTRVDDPSDLPTIIPQVLAGELLGVSLRVDGVTQTLMVSPTPPLSAPGTVNFTASLEGLALGPHQVCARAEARDDSGSDDVEECVTIHVFDPNRPPVAQCEDVTVVVDALCEAEASVNNGSFDPDHDAFECEQVPGGPYSPFDDNVVTLTCTDEHGASNSCTANVNAVDQSPPSITCPPDVFAECSNGAANVQFGALTSMDNCGIGAPSCDHAPGSFPAGDTTVTCGVEDLSGNEATCDFSVSVQDNTAPVVTTRGVMATLWPPNHQYVDLSLANCVTSIVDGCEGSLNIANTGRITRVTSDEDERAQGSGNTCDDAVITGDTTFRVRSERRGNGDGRVYSVFFTVADDSGNETPASCTVIVPHDQGQGNGAVNSGCAFCTGEGCGTCSLGSPACN